jgi:hypothetical protein
VPKPGFEKDLAKRTLTNLYNLRPAWLAQAHAQLDAAVAAAYGWADYTADMPDDEILRRLLALITVRAVNPSQKWWVWLARGGKRSTFGLRLRRSTDENETHLEK